MERTAAELAEDIVADVLPRPGFATIDRGEFFFVAAAHGASVQRLRLREIEAAVSWVRDECTRRRVRRCAWLVGWSATPSDLADQLVGLGFVPDDKDATLTAMSIDHAPPASPEVEVRRIETLAQQLEALEADWDVSGHPEAERAQRRAHEREWFDLDTTAHHFAAYMEGQAIGFARSVDMHRGVALTGGSVLPRARGRGVYRALVHARWQHAASRGTPLLVVQAGQMSQPVLDRLGFRSHGVLRLFRDPQVAAEHGRSLPHQLL